MFDKEQFPSIHMWIWWKITSKHQEKECKWNPIRLNNNGSNTLLHARESTRKSHKEHQAQKRKPYCLLESEDRALLSDQQASGDTANHVRGPKVPTGEVRGLKPTQLSNAHAMYQSCMPWRKGHLSAHPGDTIHGTHRWEPGRKDLL